MAELITKLKETFDSANKTIGELAEAFAKVAEDDGYDRCPKCGELMTHDNHKIAAIIPRSDGTHYRWWCNGEYFEQTRMFTE